MYTLNFTKLAALRRFSGKKTLIYSALVATSLMTGNAARAFDLTGGLPDPISIDGATSIDGQMQEWTAILEPVGVLVDPTDLENATIKYKQEDVVRLENESGDLVTIGNLGNILDPTGSFSLKYTDLGAPSSFFTTLTFAPFAPTMTGLVNFTGSLAGSVTDGSSPRNGVSYQPIAPNISVFTYTLFDLNNTAVASFGFDPGASFVAGPPDTHTVGSFESGLIADCGAVGCGTVKVSSAFTGSGGTDRYGFTGRWDATEPLTSVVGHNSHGNKIFLTFEQYRKIVHRKRVLGSKVRLRSSVSAASTPEPSTTMPLVLLGLIGLWGLKKKSTQSPE